MAKDVHAYWIWTKEGKMPRDNDPVVMTISSYETKSDEYIRNTDQLSYFPDLPAMLDKFLELLPGNFILDIAFGAGRDTTYFIEKKRSVVGIELTQSFIKHLQLKTNNPICKMDMRSLAFDNNTFDGVWCCAAFLHIPRLDSLSTLKEYSRVLKTNGILYFDLKEGMGEEWKSEGNVNEARRFFTYYRLEEITDLVEKAGFKIVYKRIQDHAKKIQGLAKPSWLNLLCQKK